MKATGIVRRIDDLGRIVITKDIRRKLNIREGDPLELFVGEDFVALKRYNPAKSVRSSLSTLNDAVMDEPLLKNKDALIEKIREMSELLESSGGGAE